ncbi:MAG TPA: hypothetical protein V6C57_21740 [Coleofasciculaceae cyanobacterium]
MNFYAVNLQDLSLAIAALSIVLCPTLCGMMAYRVSREYQLR